MHAHGLKAGWTALLAGRPGVITVHNIVLDEPGGGPMTRLARRTIARLERFVVERSRGVIVTAPELVARYPRAHHVTVIRPVHAVPPVRRDRAVVRGELGIDGPLVVCVARLHPQKGIDLLLDATVGFPAGTSVVIVGDGPARGELVARAAQQSLASVRFLGARSDAVDLLGAADVVVIPSRWESGPLVLLEALAVGAAVVTTDVGFVRAVAAACPDREPFVVVAPDAGALAREVAGLLDDLPRRRAVAAAGRRVVGQFLDREPGVSTTIALYRVLAR